MILKWTITGVLCGAIFSTAMTVIHWASWEPYSPLMIPYELVFFSIAGGIVFAIFGAALSRLNNPVVLSGLSLVVVLAPPTGIWVWALYGTGGGIVLKLLSVAAYAIAAGLILFRVVRKRIGRRSLEELSLVAAVAVSSSIIGYEMWSPWALLYPVTIVLIAIDGLPRTVESSASRRWVSLGVAFVIDAVCALMIFPWSNELVNTQVKMPSAPGPSVILIVIDTLRQDHMSLYGYDRRTSPNIDRWAQDALVFDVAVSASSWTLPSHASMFTGLFPKSHGAHGYRGTTREDSARPLDEQFTTVAELAAENGIATAAIVGNHSYLDTNWQLNQGFQTYWVGKPRFPYRFPVIEGLARRIQPFQFREFCWFYYRDRYITDNVIRWLDATKGRPFFLFVNYMDVHGPRLRAPTAEIPDSGFRFDDRKDLDSVLQGNPIGPGAQRALIDGYDREIMHLDQDLERLFEYLDTSGLSLTTSVILTSDHGEYLGEHNLVFHSMHLHQEVIRVPFLIKGPGIDPGRSRKPVRSVDVFSTVLELLGIQYVGETHSHSALGNTSGPLIAEWYAAEFPGFLKPGYADRFNRDLRAMQLDRYKIFLDEHAKKELYDIEHDPHEKHDIASQLDGTADSLAARLEDHIANFVDAPAVQARPSLTPNDLERLRALGYIE